MKKPELKKISDEYFHQNLYWKLSDQGVIEPTEKWRKLIDTLMPKVITRAVDADNKPYIKIDVITPELLADTINNDKLSRRKNAGARFQYVQEPRKYERKSTKIKPSH